MQLQSLSRYRYSLLLLQQLVLVIVVVVVIQVDSSCRSREIQPQLPTHSVPILVQVQVGGSDQWGNITAGTDLLRKLSDKTEEDKEG